MAIVILGGTTGAGKSDLAISLAERWDATIVSADAMTVYRGMDIGTAKPVPEVLSRIPHACVDVVLPQEEFSVSDFVDAFTQARSTSSRILVVGGTPFYLAALVRPLADMPAADARIRTELEGLEDPHRRLAEVDPERASRLHPNDRMRVIRALEVFELSGQTMTALHAAGSTLEPVDATVLWMDVDTLDDRIEQRLHGMVEAGYVGEVERLLLEGCSPDLKPMRSFGYRHMVEHVQGEISLEEAIRRTARDTRRFARKQRTWARGMGWSAVGPEEAATVADTVLGATPQD